MQTIEQLVPTAMRELTTQPEPVSQFPKSFLEQLAFETLKDAELEKLVQRCWQWRQAFERKESARWISILGESGTGKTHCAERLWTWAQKRADWNRCAYSAAKIYWPDFIQKLRTGEYFPYREDMKKWPVLFLDDIGAERDPSGFAAEELHTLLGCRMNKWTLLTSNKSPEALKKIDERIYSRMIRGQNICVGVKTKDYSDR